jgi:hypothetical protein
MLNHFIIESIMEIHYPKLFNDIHLYKSNLKVKIASYQTNSYHMGT